MNSSARFSGPSFGIDQRTALWPRLALLAALTLFTAALSWTTPAYAGSCSPQAGTVTDSKGTTFNTLWYCGNRKGAKLYANPDFGTAVNYMNTTRSWFVCYQTGAQHAGGNNIWYYSLGDKPRGAWGYMPAVNILTSTDPWPGIPKCSGSGPVSGPTSGAIPPVVASNTDGRLEVFARDNDGSLWHKWQMVPSGDWSAWASLGGQVSEFAVAQNDDGRLEVFAIGYRRAVYHIWQTAPGGAWSTWENQGGNALKLAAAKNHDGRLEVFAIFADKSLQHNWQVGPGGSFSGWATLGGSFTDLSVAENQDGRLEVFVITARNVPLHISQSAPGGSWNAWDSLGGQVLKLAVARNQDGRLEVFGVGTDHQLYHDWQTSPGGSYSGWYSLGDWIDQLAVARAPSGSLVVFGRGSDRTMRSIWQTSPDAGWSHWVSLGGKLDQLAIGVNIDGRMEVFTLGQGTSIRRTLQNCAGCDWGGWSVFGAPANNSGVGGTITRSEIISRANYWVSLNPAPHYYWDADTRFWVTDPLERLYRPDCSGYVSMAWHLGVSRSTVDLINEAYAIRKNQLAAGDIMGTLGAGTDGDHGHVRIFHKWDNTAHTLYSAYDFGATPPKYKTGIKYPDTNMYNVPLKPYRYRKVSD
ncbi:MAG: hypothetical protein PHE55_13930 [Methylococcaceae bacterium]|nr:hypothetical protein [Methylococcaceae bacterium]